MDIVWYACKLRIVWLQLCPCNNPSLLTGLSNCLHNFRPAEIEDFGSYQCYGRRELVCWVLIQALCDHLYFSWCWSHVNKVNHTCPVILAPVVEKLDSAIDRINLYPVDNAIGFPNTYPPFEQVGPGLSSLFILVSYDINSLGSIPTLRWTCNLLQKYILKCHFHWNIHSFQFHEVWQKSVSSRNCPLCVCSFIFFVIFV